MWPPDYRLGASEPVSVLDGSGHTVATVGQVIELGGGDYQADEITSFLVQGASIPTECRLGPFWLAKPL